MTLDEEIMESVRIYMWRAENGPVFRAVLRSSQTMNKENEE